MLVTSAYRVSVFSVGWTLCVGSTAIVVGVVGNSLALITFGAIGLLDSVGSVFLSIHFFHVVHHEDFSDRRERIALWAVTGGMALIGILTVADSAYRLVAHSRSGSVLVGDVLAGISVIVLAVLATKKRRIGGQLPSRALVADGAVSGLGAILAVVTLAGTALASGLGWWWLDPIAALMVALGATALSARLALGGTSNPH